ncbi:MAG TPA: glycosyltransferase [Thermoanaerobaculia bacterium]|nr:glycosyltransferase [Thermoanaerobaculia bacterium]
MIRTIGRVIRGEGFRSAIRRANERVGDALHSTILRARGAISGAGDAAILNVAASGTAVRLGGVQSQLGARLDVERTLRSVALLEPGLLHLSEPRAHARRITTDLETGIREALAITGARSVHFEGMDGVPIDAALRLIESGIRVIVSIHDFSLFCARPHLLEEPPHRFCFYSQDLDRCHRCLQQTWDVATDAQFVRRTLGRKLLASATGVIFPSRFLLDQHGLLFSLPDLAGEVIEPGVPSTDARVQARGAGRAIAYAGSVKRHKGAHLLPELARLLGDRGLHVFGGGDEDLLRAMRRVPNITLHGYYRNGTLPHLLARHGIGLVLLPSIVPESFSLTLSEAWLAGVTAAAFDLGAQAERIRLHGGGWLAPLESGAAGLARIIEEWTAGRLTTSTPQPIASPSDAARAHVALYRRWGAL